MPGRIGLVNEHGRVHEVQREGCRHGFSLSETERRRIVQGRRKCKLIISEWSRVMSPPLQSWLDRSQKVFQTSCRRKQRHGL